MILSFALAAVIDLRLELVRESLTGTHCRYREYIQDIPTDDYVSLECGNTVAAFLPRGAAAEPLRWINRRLTRREIRDNIAYDYDVKTNALVRTVPLYFEAKPARIFDPNPVVARNDPSLQDRNDSAAAVPDSAYRIVDLQDVAESGPLRGPHVALVDRQAPNIAPPDGSSSLLFNRNDSGFEDVNAYAHIDGTQRYLQSLGYTGRRAIAPYAVETDAHALNGLDNSFFLPSATSPGTGTLFFGEGGTDDAEDADLVVHEYGHAILEWIAPGTFAGPFSSQGRAFSEAFGDYWAFSAHYAQRIASGRDAFCFADWDPRCWEDKAAEQCSYPPGSDCLRRLDSPRTMANYDTSETAGVEHRNGQIFSSALRELFLALGRQVTDTIVVESVFGAPPLPSFATMAQRMIEADRLLYGGAHASAICAVMTARGIFAANGCELAPPRGEWTHVQSSDRSIAIPEANPAGIVSRLTVSDARAIERLFVRVDIAHESRGDLRIELVAPDGPVILLKDTGVERTRDLHVTFGFDASSAEPLDVLRGRSAAGVWQLRVADLRARDVGTLLSWGLVIQFAGDVPVAQRPRAERTQMIPAVGHRFGANETFFVSDVRIANVRATPQTATLIFTRDGDDGRTSFSAVKVAIDAGQTVAFDDIVDRAFHTSGTGTLEVLGDVVVMSRTYVPLASGGTVGQSVPPNLDQILGGGAGGVIPVFPLPTHRSRIGITDVGGTGAAVFFSFGLELRRVDVPPYSHVELPGFQQSSYSFGASGQGARVVAYVTQIDNATGDAMFIPAIRTPAAPITRIAPAVDATGLNASSWRSDLWIPFAPNTHDISFVDASRGDTVTRRLNAMTFFPGVLREQFGRADTMGMLVAQIPTFGNVATRITNDGTSEYVPFVDPQGPVEQHLVFIESNASFRTNIGIIANEAAVAEVVVYDSAGHELDRRLLDTPRGLASMAVTPHVINGRAVVRFLTGRGQAFASMIDNKTGDAALIPGQ